MSAQPTRYRQLICSSTVVIVHSGPVVQRTRIRRRVVRIGRNENVDDRVGSRTVIHDGDITERTGVQPLQIAHDIGSRGNPAGLISTRGTASDSDGTTAVCGVIAVVHDFVGAQNGSRIVDRRIVIANINDLALVEFSDFRKLFNRASRTSPRKRVMCPRENIFLRGLWLR